MRQRFAALIIAGLLALGVTGCLPSDAEKGASSAQQTTPVATPDWEEVKAQSQAIGYRELFRNNEQYVGQRFYFRGKIVQVIEQGENTFDFRVDVEPDSLDSAIVYLAEYTGQRLLDDDRIEFVGAAAGLQRYESIFGQHITIPRLKAVVVRWLGPCADGVAVPNPQDNPGLVADCSALLEAKDVMAGGASLNWSADRAITTWDGITVSGSPPRVTALNLSKRSLADTVPPQLGALRGLQVLNLRDNQLSGPIPPELGALTFLRHFDLSDNALTGPMPPQLGALTNLEQLELSNNQLSGSIPPELGTLANLQGLILHTNQLSGSIPPELGALANLQALALNNNQLTGPIPPELGALVNLQWLFLNDNQLTGAFPTELGALANLEILRLGGNALTGCLPEELRGVAINDFGELGLPLCGA